MNDLLRITELPLRIEPRDQVRDLFLSQSAPGDVAVIGLDDDYLTFLSTAREHGIRGPILLIAEEPTIVTGDLHRYNALVLDLKRTGSAEVRNIVHVVLKLAAERNGRADDNTCGDPGDRSDEAPITDVLAIQERLDHVQKKALPVILAFETRQEGEAVTARGLCTIREVLNEAVVLHKFKQSLLLRSMKKDMPVRVYFTYKHRNHGSSVSVRQVAAGELTISVPASLFITREMRIQPNPNRPVVLYVNIPNEPTTQFRVMDISTRGIGFLCSRDLPIDREYSMTIMLPDPQAVVVTSGTIRFKKDCGDGIRYGAEIRTHPWDEENLAKYVMKRESEIVGLLRNL